MSDNARERIDRAIREGEEAWSRLAEQVVGDLADDYEAAVVALQEIAARPVVERNPDGVDQAAHTMRLIAREALVALGEAQPRPATRLDVAVDLLGEAEDDLANANPIEHDAVAHALMMVRGALDHLGEATPKPDAVPAGLDPDAWSSALSCYKGDRQLAEESLRRMVEGPAPSAPAGGAEAASGPSLDGSGRLFEDFKTLGRSFAELHSQGINGVVCEPGNAKISRGNCRACRDAWERGSDVLDRYDPKWGGLLRSGGMFQPDPSSSGQRPSTEPLDGER